MSKNRNSEHSLVGQATAAFAAKAKSDVQVEDEPQHVFGLVDGVVMRKLRFTCFVYPELADSVERMVRLIEHAYEDGVRKGLGEEQKDDSSRSSEY